MVIDDLTPADLQEKRRVSPLMKKLYEQGKRPRFHGGKLYVGGRPLKPQTIEKLLSEVADDDEHLTDTDD